jgi:hypothetical protein
VQASIYLERFLIIEKTFPHFAIFHGFSSVSSSPYSVYSSPGGTDYTHFGPYFEIFLLGVILLHCPGTPELVGYGLVSRST